MAKQRHALSGKVVAITGGARGIGKATATALVRKGCRVAIGDLDLALAEETAAGARRRHRRAATRRHRPRLLRRLPRRGRAPARARSTSSSTTPGSCRSRPSSRSADGLDPAPDRHQPPRRHRRHPAGDRAVARRAAPATSSTSPRRRAKAASRDRHLLGDQARRGRAQRGGAGRAARHRYRDRLRDADRGQHRADQRRRPALGQTGRGRGRRQRDRRGAGSAALRRLGAAGQRRPLQGSSPCCRAACARRSAGLMKVDKLMTEVDHGARHGLRGAGRPQRAGPSRRRGREAAGRRARSRLARAIERSSRSAMGRIYDATWGRGFAALYDRASRGERRGRPARDAPPAADRAQAAGLSTSAPAPGSTSACSRRGHRAGPGRARSAHGARCGRKLRQVSRP